jgi:hypothetical protein
MKVDRVSSPSNSPTRRTQRGGAATGSFSKALSAGEASGAGSLSGTGAVAPVDALLVLQEVSNDHQGSARHQRRGAEILDQLDELRLRLLEGRLPLATVERLANLVKSQRERVNDPALARILDEIELRAAVELAKYGR